MDNINQPEAAILNKVQLFKGYHGPELVKALKNAWDSNQTLIVCPGHIEKIPFIEKAEIIDLIPKNIILGIFTSGTLSGKPRLILYTKKNIEVSLSAIRELYDTKKIDKIFCYPQPTHAFGLILGYVHAHLNSIPIAFLEGPYNSKAHEMWYAEATSGMVTLGTPTHFIDLIHWVQKNNIIPKKTYSAILGGASVTKKLWNDLVTKLNIESPSIGYGASEASPGITHLGPGVEPKQDGDIGNLLKGITIEEIDSAGYFFHGQNLCEAIIDENGIQFPKRILIKDTMSEISPNHFIFEGRSDLLINRGGLKFSPEAIEGTLFSSLGLKSVCVSIYSERLGEELGLVIQKNLESNASEINQQLSAIKQILNEKHAVQINSELICFDDIPLNGSAKFDRVESIRVILKKMNIQKPIRVDYLKSFLPHRLTAVWIHRITDFGFRQGRAEVDLNLDLSLFSNSKMRESACIELVAQTYGYATAAYLIYNSEKKEKANKTLIAEIRNAEFYFSNETELIISQAIDTKIPLVIEANCSHDFGAIKLIQGKVLINNILLAQLNLKAFVAE
ncbi:MAG: class I adenylate-forming enzyme family protein [Pseudobdellovibrio sp.]